MKEKAIQVVNFKATETQVANYANAALAAGKDRSKWIKRTLDAAVKRSKPR